MRHDQRFLPILILLFFGSGTAALIYEVVWFQLLQLVIGSSAVSLGVILGTFMGGLCLGSLLLHRMVTAHRHPFRVFALLESGTAIFGVLIVFAMPYAAGLYTGLSGYGVSSLLGRALVCSFCLLPPTLLMGATLPAIARWIAATSRGISALGFVYAANIAGGVFGSLFAGFYLLRVYDMVVATYVAAGINLIVAAIAAAAATSGGPRIADEVTDHHQKRQSVSRAVYVTIALSGLAALGAQVVWTRLLSLLLGASVYSFAIILAVFLLGLGIGTTAGSAVARRSGAPQRDLGICQLLAAAAIAWSGYMLTRQLPYWPIDSTAARGLWFNFSGDLARAAFAILPATCVWGASFPLALAAVAVRGVDAARSAGGVYAANTAGAIAGALGFSLAFIPFFGTQRAQLMLFAISVAAALLMLQRVAVGIRKNPRLMVVVVCTAVLLGVLAVTISPTPKELIGYGRFTAETLSYRDPRTHEPFKPDFVYAGEGLNASVAVSQTPEGIRNFHVSGKIEASTEPRDMRLQRMLGHLSALAHPSPRSVLVVGFGAGITAGSFVTHPGIERIVICEIEPLIPAVVASYFASENYNVTRDPRVQIVYDDARHFLFTSGEKFDVITSDPIHPWVKGAATLYSREYFELARRHLNPGGVISQWVPLYQSSFDAVKSAMATFFEVFPDGTVWSNDVAGRGYDIVLLGRDTTDAIDVEEWDRRLNRPDHSEALRSLNAVKFGSAQDLLARFAGQGRDLAPWLAGAEINRDRSLRLQYLAGLAVNTNEGNAIHESMLAYRKFPPVLFAGTPERLQNLKNRIERPAGRALTGAEAAAVTETLKLRPRQLSISAVSGDEEAAQYATQLHQVITAAGWEVAPIRQSVFSERIVGMLIAVGSDPPPAAANELFRALRAAGLTVEGSLNPNAGSDSVSLFIGSRDKF